MKKLLFSILTILGIGCSFCSAVSYNFNYMQGVLYFGKVPSVSSQWGLNLSGYTLSMYNSWGGSFMVYDENDLVLATGDSIIYTPTSNDFGLDCANPGDGCYIEIYSVPYNSIGPDFSLGLSSTASFMVYGKVPSVSSQWGYDFSGYTLSMYSNIPFMVYDENDNFISSGTSIVYTPTSANWGLDCSDSNEGCFISVYSVPYNAFVQSTPKFKVNYGITSYEYELDSDLSIYLKSPVVQSGNTFTYAGSTGLNLFYNGTSQRYNKSNLYLDSMFWYNKNIFTPICL